MGPHRSTLTPALSQREREGMCWGGMFRGLRPRLYSVAAMRLGERGRVRKTVRAGCAGSGDRSTTMLKLWRVGPAPSSTMLRMATTSPRGKGSEWAVATCSVGCTHGFIRSPRCGWGAGRTAGQFGTTSSRAFGPEGKNVAAFASQGDAQGYRISGRWPWEQCALKPPVELKLNFRIEHLRVAALLEGKG